MPAPSACSARFITWWRRTGRRYGSALGWDEGRRYGMLWYAYRTGWHHAQKELREEKREPPPG
ncbi:MAG TPA: hypothetical protein VF764_09025 [Steroidobacteraceae bacterium]